MPLIAKPTGILEAPLTTVEDIAKKFVIEDDGCWSWTGWRSPDGYSQYSVAGRTKRVHRIMWELLGNEVDPTKELDHLCRTRHCVNPKHMEQVTARVNNLRGQSIPSKNAKKTHCSRGHEFSGYNLCEYKYLNKASEERIMRKCRPCRNRLVAEHHERKKAKILQKESL